MHELRLQLLQAGFGLLSLGQIPDETGEEALVAGAHFADSELHREGRSVAALANDHTPDPDDPPLSGAQIALEVAVVALAIRRWHQHLDVLADNVRRRMAEQAFGGAAE